MALYIRQTDDGGTMFLCGDLGPHCGECNWVADYLCDYPVGNGTCDRHLCRDHAFPIAENTHYCSPHYARHVEENPLPDGLLRFRKAPVLTRYEQDNDKSGDSG